MATRYVRGSSANAIKNPASFLWQLASMYNRLVGYRIGGNPAFARNSNFDVANANAHSYINAGVWKTLAATQNFDTGTARVIAADQWAAALLSIDGSGNPVVTWGSKDFASEAAAIAALKGTAAGHAAADPACPTANTPAGYITVKTGAGVSWTAGTDALAAGAGGNPATTTNYYNGDVDDLISTVEIGQP